MTDIDLDWAYLASTTAYIQEVAGIPVLDAFATRPTNPARSGMDTINDPNGRILREI
jgi:hypothetical protein